MVMLRPTSIAGEEELIENIKIIDFGLANHLSEL